MKVSPLFYNMDNKIFIPKLCKVGFNKRSDTYTGKLGYVIYNDGKVWRKEKSWEGWREKQITTEEFNRRKLEEFNNRVKQLTNNFQSDQYRNPPKGAYAERYVGWSLEEFLKEYGANSIDTYSFNLPGYTSDQSLVPIEFENTPVEGFVLNKDVGGVKRYSSWDQRTEKVRIYDPRGFEFEITIPNLLYILQNTSSIKGKGIEGNMIYGWSGSDLVLIPENAPEYQEMLQFTELQSKKVSKKDLVVGGIYIDRSNERITFMGESMHYGYDRIPTSKKLWWTSKYGFQTSPIDSIKLYTGEIDSNYAELNVKIESNTSYKPAKIATVEYIPYTEEEAYKEIRDSYSWRRNFYILINGKYKNIYTTYTYKYKSKGVEYIYGIKRGRKSEENIAEYSTVKELLENYPLYKRLVDGK